MCGHKVKDNPTIKSCDHCDKIFFKMQFYYRWFNIELSKKKSWKSLKPNGNNKMFKVVNLYNYINKRVKLYKTCQS